MDASGLKMIRSGLNMSGSRTEYAKNEWVKNAWKWVGVHGVRWE